MQATPVKEAATALGLDVFTPERVRDVESMLRERNVRLFAVASYGKILPQSLLDIPALGAFNVHPSLLPLYRGATPLQAQIRDMVAETGVTIIAMDAGMDTGDVLVQERTPLGSRETYGELEARLANLGAELLVRAIEESQAGAARRIRQETLAAPEAIAATLTHPLRGADLQIDWTKSATGVDAFVRSLAPQPMARATIAGIACKVLEVHPIALDSKETPGATVRIPRGVAVACGSGAVAVDRVVPASRNVMSGEAFAASLFART